MTLLNRVQQLVMDLRELGVIDNDFCNISYHTEQNGEVDLMLLFTDHTPDIKTIQNAFKKEFETKFMYLSYNDYMCFRVFK